MTNSATATPRYAYWVIFFAAIGGMLYGYDLGVIGPALMYMQRDIPMSTIQQGILGGCVFAGGALATLISGWLADLLGRRSMIFMAAICFCFGVLVTVFAFNYTMLMVGRICQGIGVGVITIVIPLYLAETVPAKIRGRAVSAFQLLLTFSIMLAYLVGLFFHAQSDWRAMFLTALIPGILLLIGACKLPRSPRWLLLKNKTQAAKTVLLKTHGFEQAAIELQKLSQLRDTKKTSSAKSNLHPALVWIPLTIVLFSAILTQLTGINSLLQYSPIIFKSAGMSSEMIAILSGITVTAINFCVSAIAMLIVDKVGRRPLLITGTIAVAISLLYSGFVFALLPAGIVRGELFLCGLLVYIMGFAFGPGLVIWLIISELLPDQIRSTGMSVALFLNSITSFMLAASYLSIGKLYGLQVVFWGCGLLTLLYAVLALFFIPETNGKTLSDITLYFENRYLKRRKEQL